MDWKQAGRIFSIVIGLCFGGWVLIRFLGQEGEPESLRGDALQAPFEAEIAEIPARVPARTALAPSAPLQEALTGEIRIVDDWGNSVPGALVMFPDPKARVVKRVPGDGSVLTDSSGRATVDLKLPRIDLERGFMVAVHAKGFLSRTVSFRGLGPWDVVLKKARPTRIEARDLRGFPVAGVRIYLSQFTMDSGEFEGSDLTGDLRYPIGKRPIFSGLTDEHGECFIDGVPEGAYCYKVSSQDFVCVNHGRNPAILVPGVSHVLEMAPILGAAIKAPATRNSTILATDPSVTGFVVYPSSSTHLPELMGAKELLKVKHSGATVMVWLQRERSQNDRPSCKVDFLLSDGGTGEITLPLVPPSQMTLSTLDAASISDPRFGVANLKVTMPSGKELRSNCLYLQYTWKQGNKVEIPFPFGRDCVLPVGSYRVRGNGCLKNLRYQPLGVRVKENERAEREFKVPVELRRVVFRFVHDLSYPFGLASYGLRQGGLWEAGVWTSSRERERWLPVGLVEIKVRADGFFPFLETVEVNDVPDANNVQAIEVKLLAAE